MRARVTVALVLMGLVAALSVAAPGPAGRAVARESLSATGLSITPQIAYERAILRVAGPGDFHGQQRFEAGAAIEVDLASIGRRSAASRSQRPTAGKSRPEGTVLPDGRYKFEVSFHAKGRKIGVHSGMFFVEGGLAISREAKRAQLSALRGDLARDRRSLSARSGSPQMSTERPGAPPISTEAPATEAGVADYLVVYPTLVPYYSWAALGNYNTVLNTPQAWSMVHYYGDLNFSFGGYPYPLGNVAGYPYPQITFEAAYFDVSYSLYTQGPEIGIGTTSPYAPLDVNGTNYYTQLLAFTGWNGYLASVGLGPVGLWLYDDDYEPIAQFNHAARASTLTVDYEGVGIGDFSYAPYYPAQDLHVRAAEPQILVESLSGTTTGRTMFFMKNKGNVQFFFENTDSTDIWQMSQLSTVFQISSPSTGLGKFRVRKNGGLQALRGSTTILDLDSAGNLEVTSVTQTSSREAKKGFEAVNGLSVLEKVAALPISEWSYKADSPNVRHLGPMSEDFHAAFGLGRDDKGLTSVDTSGVALAAIQGLNQKLIEKEARVQELIENNAQLEQRLLELEQLVQSLAEP